MGNIMDYISWRGDLTFATAPLNEVDNLILSELAYIDFGKVMPMTVPTRPFPEPVSLEETYRRYSTREYHPAKLSHDPFPLFAAAAKSRRFSDVSVLAYTNVVDDDTTIQFSSTVFKVGEIVFVAFRGTDDNLVGWREDFVTFYQDTNSGQLVSVQFVNGVLGELEGEVILGGHSKGGNLAIYAGAFCQDRIQNRIRRIYSNDGPGFSEAVINSPEYRGILDRVNLIIPESSLISLILSNTIERRVIESSGSKGMEQHNPYTWDVMGDHFVEADAQSQESLLMDETLSRWVESMDEKEKAHLVNGLFDAMEAAGARTLGDLGEGRWAINRILFQVMRNMSTDVQEDVKSALKKFAATYLEVRREEKPAKPVKNHRFQLRRKDK